MQRHGVTFKFTFDLAVVTLTYKNLSGLYLSNCEVYEVDTY